MEGGVVRTIALAAVVAALVVTAGCGGGGGGQGNDVDEDPGATATPAGGVTPGRTPTVLPTTTPVGATPTGGTPIETTSSVTTPVATATPAGTTNGSVAFTVTSSTALFGFQFTVTYPTAKGGFVGSANSVRCSAPSREIFTKNDQDDGHLILSLANPFPLAFPVSIECTFEADGGQSLLVGDLGITATEVTDETGAVGDPETLTVAVGVS